MTTLDLGRRVMTIAEAARLLRVTPADIEAALLDGTIDQVGDVAERRVDLAGALRQMDPEGR